MTPDLFNPNRGGFISTQQLPTRRSTADVTADQPSIPGSELNRLKDPQPGPPAPPPTQPAPSRIGQLPTYDLQPASGAAASGYDSLNRKRKQPKYYPGQAKPKPSPGPGTPAPTTAVLSSTGQPPPIAPPPSASANKTPLPQAMAGTVPGQPARRRLKLDDDPFGPVGDYAGSFLVKGALELSGGYDSNPGRLNKPIGSPAYMVSPELLVMSNWERHALVADL